MVAVIDEFVIGRGGMTEEAMERIGKSCQEFLLVLAAREFATRDQPAEAFAQMRADDARKLAEATPRTGKVLAGPWKQGTVTA